MCDKLVYDLSQEIEGSPNIFIRKDWLNILDNMNQNYQSNQSIIDTSQLSNSNKWMSYREGYLAVPMLLSITTPNTNTVAFTFSEYSLGLKNWFGTIIHSMTLDYNGTTIIQQTPFCNMWNSFKLLTSFSYNDIITQGDVIGFYPDTAGSFAYTDGTFPVKTGLGTINNDLARLNTIASITTSNNYNQWNPASGFGGNEGLTNRIKNINWSSVAGIPEANEGYVAYGGLLSANNMTQIWKSNLTRSCASNANTVSTQVNATTAGVYQVSVMATIYLKHLHSFFNMIPLLKGVFMKLTLNLNNSTTTITLDNTLNDIQFSSYSSTVPVGGVNPLLIPSINTGSSWINTGRFANGNQIRYNISVGSVCTDGSLGLSQAQVGNVAKSIYLYVPAYSFNNTFLEAYLSSSPKQIKYTDIYQYQILNIGAGQNFNNLITNGIANIKSVLVIPFFTNGRTTVGGTDGAFQQWQSPFDTAGAGTTAPMVALGNFNVQISGQNAIYNNQKYLFEEYCNQLYGENAVNGGLTDGLTSGLISFLDWQNLYCYYYVNVERMLPVEKSVPKSVQLLGTNYSQRAINLWVFIEYEVEIRIDLGTGSRV